MKTFKVLLIDGSIIGVDATHYEYKNLDGICFYNGASLVALFNFKNIMGITKFEEE